MFLVQMPRRGGNSGRNHNFKPWMWRYGREQESKVSALRAMEAREKIVREALHCGASERYAPSIQSQPPATITSPPLRDRQAEWCVPR